jgi:hypothetical protein
MKRRAGPSACAPPELTPRALGGAGFDRIVDAGLGAGPHQYLEMLIQSFATGADTANEFPDRDRDTQPDELLKIPAYSELVDRLIAEGGDRGDAECGLVEIAGTTVAASFVGAVAASLTLSEPLRLLHGGLSCDALGFSLRSPEHLDLATRDAGAAPRFGSIPS